MEAADCRVMIIQWLYEGKYDKIIPLNGGVHPLLLKLKILLRKYGPIGIKAQKKVDTR